MCCKKKTLIFITVLEIVLNLCLLAKCGRIKRVVGGTDVKCDRKFTSIRFDAIICPSAALITASIKWTEPRVASLRNSSTLRHICGATLLSPQFALTAAHCVSYDKQQYTLRLNNYCTKDDEPLPRADILEIIKHQMYDPFTRAHDVALLRLALHLDDTTWLNDTLLPTSSFGISGECTVYGYGYEDLKRMETSERLLAGTLRIVSLDKCTEALGPYVAPLPDSGMMCAVGDSVDACQGDSGSPLICSGTIEGLSSYGMSCAVPGLPGVYLNIGAHLPWIRKLIRNNKGCK